MTQRDPATGPAPAAPPALAGIGALDAGPPPRPAAPPLSAELAAAVAGLGSDITLVLDDAGVILRAVGDPALAPPDGWVGRPWADTVTGETRAKVEQLLRDVSDVGISRRREVNHPAPGGGQDIPVAYAAMRLGPDGPVLAAGRDLRAIAAIQQRFVASQQELERGYWRLRHAESRYRLLFQVATDAVCVLDLPALGVVEANAAAHALFGAAPGQLLGTGLSEWLDPPSRIALDERLSADGAGRDLELRARLPGGRGAIELSATRFRGEHGPMLLLRARALELSPPASLIARRRLAEVVDRLPDAVLVTDAVGRVLSANPAFVAWAETSDDDGDGAAESRVQGRPLADWLTLQPPHSLGGLVSALRHRGLALELQASFRGDRGRRRPVLATAVLLDDDDRECLGFTLRRAGSTAADDGTPGPEAWPAAIEVLAGELGQVPYDQLVERARVEVERHFAAVALAHCGGDALAAARWLGLGDEASPSRLAAAARRLQVLVDGASHPSPRPRGSYRLN